MPRKSQPEKSPATQPASVIAQGGGVAIGGHAEHNVIVTVDGAQIPQELNVPGFVEELAELRALLERSDLEEEVREDLVAEVASVERLARRQEPNGEMIAGKLETVTRVLEGARKLGESLAPVARQLGAAAGQLFL